MRVIKNNTYKGTRILLGNEKQDYIQKCREILKAKGYTEIQIPIIQYSEIFNDKVGKENNNLMYRFKDRGNRDLCLAPEYTAVIQQLSSVDFKNEKNVKLFYVSECFRGEKPQKGRYRQFTQLGVEVLNPTSNNNIILLAQQLVELTNIKYNTITKKKRGLDYYKHGEGFELEADDLAVCGGGKYDNGIGFAIGVDRLII